MENSEAEVLERLDSDVAHARDDGQWFWISDNSPIDSKVMASLAVKGMVGTLCYGSSLIAQMTWEGRQAMEAKVPQKTG